MKGKEVILILLLIFSQFNILFANKESIKIEDYSYKDGLTTSYVYNAYKDSRGYLWLCTLNGLYRYDGYNFRKINSFVNEVSSYETLCITEDKDQNLWIGTSGNGIFHYNTHTEKIVQVKISTGDDFKAYQILFFNDKIWVATYNGLLVITAEKFFNENNTLQAQTLLPDPVNYSSQVNKITTLYFIPGSDMLWVGTNGSLFFFDTKTFEFEPIKSHPQNSIRALANYGENVISGSWDGGVFVVNSQSKKIENDAFINYVNEVVGNKRIMSIYFDDHNRLWLATYGNGLFIFNKSKKGTGTFQNFKNDQNKNGNLKSDIINHLYVDNSGIVWLCMNQPGLSKIYFQKENLNYISLSDQINKNELLQVITLNQSSDKNKLWIATNGQGIYLFDVRNQKLTNYKKQPGSLLHLIENDVSICYQDRKGNLWIVYRHFGLYILTAQDAKNLLNGTLQSEVKPIEANILLSTEKRTNLYLTKLFEDSKGRMWIGTWGSLYVLDIKQGFSKSKNSEDLISESDVKCVYIATHSNEINYPISPVLSIFEENQNHFWLGTFDKGIIELTETDNAIFSGKQIELNKKLSTNNVQSIYKDKKQNIWIGTNAGLYHINTITHVLKAITLDDGLSSDNINNIIEDKNSNIWISTSYGISSINIESFVINNYFFNDRLNIYITNAAAYSANGFICFSTTDALVTINPDSVKNELSSAPLYFTDIKINNMTVNPLEKYNGTLVIESNINECKEINIPYNHTLNIEFAALDYIHSKRFLYKYRIGSKNEWITLNANQRSLIMPSMKPGEYTLSVMISGSSLKDNIRTITLNYLPPFWQSKLALLGYLIFLLILFLTYRKLIIQRVLQKSVIEKERYERKKLEELDKMKSEFFTNISHEFRTPLSLIINPLDQLTHDNQLSDKNRSKINLILKSSNRLLKLTNELMSFGKIEKELLKPDFESCEIVALVKESCQLFNNLVDSMHIDFGFSSQIDQLIIPIDKGMIEKVIFNLLSNAFKYTPNHGVVMVNISNNRNSENEYVKISVINSGAGISKENLDKIFDRYYQVSNIQNRTIEGTGIGLSLVKSFIELHNGKIEVQSEPNVETSFDIYLPLQQVNFNTSVNTIAEISDSANIEQIKSSTESIAIKPAFHYQLLLIEDDDDIRYYIISELSTEFKIDSAKDGIEGLRLANEIVPDLIITDVIMPGLSGTDLCVSLKKQVTTSHIPIIILSAKTTVEQQIEGLEMGADVYMIKPFNIEHLKTQVITLLRFKENVYARFLKENALIPEGALSTKIDEEFFQKVLIFIEENLSDTELNVDQLANHVALSKVQVYRKLKAISGQSVVEFIRTVRLKKAAQMVVEKKMSFFEIAYETGFSTPSYFTKCFHDHFGKTPTEFATDYGDKLN